MVQNSSLIEDEYVGLYFSRMNKAGITPDEEEIRYSLLKSKVQDLKYIDKIAKDRMTPARLANIAMAAFLTQKQRKWIADISNESVSALSKDDSFSYFIHNELERIIKDKIEKWIIYDSQENPIGLPQILYSKMAKTGKGDLFRLLLLFGQKWEKLEPSQLIPLITLINWFGNDAMVSYGYNNYYKDSGCSQSEWINATKKWIIDASFWNNHITIPPPYSIFEKDIQSIDDLWAYHDNYAYKDAIKNIWDWKSNPGRAILLYCCRDYLNNEFGQYDPSDAAWSEENCPWDYDHIVPQNWIKNSNASGPFHNEVILYINSIGNIAPVSFSINRKKKDSPPLEEGGYIEEYGKALSAIPDDYVRFDGKKVIEYNPPDLTLLLASITAKRFCRLYSSWYKDLNIDDLFGYKDSRRLLLEKIANKLKESNLARVITVFVNYKLQYVCQTNADWTHQWLALGIDLGEEKEVFPAIAVGRLNNVFHIEVGLRRHPNRTSIDGKDMWYKDNIPPFDKTYPMDFEVDDLADELYHALMNVYMAFIDAKDETITFNNEQPDT